MSTRLAPKSAAGQRVVVGTAADEGYAGLAADLIASIRVQLPVIQILSLDFGLEAATAARFERDRVMVKTTY